MMERRCCMSLLKAIKIKLVSNRFSLSLEKGYEFRTLDTYLTDNDNIKRS
jgi:hypothetical protein